MDFLFGISLTASFLAGVLALFAPCCITFLFPSYLGMVFKSSSAKASEGQGNVIFYTIVFALGLSFILIPVAFGARALIFFFDAYHQQIYYLGALFLIFMGIMTIKPLFNFPVIFHFKPQIGKKVNTVSVFGLGLMSGLTSACCAPVLFAAITLTTLSPTLIQALFVSFAYVLGIVFPLFILSLSYQKMTKRISGKNRERIYKIFKFLGAAIFIISGLAIGILAYTNRIQMYQMEPYNRGLRLAIFNIAKWFQNPFVDIAVFLIILFIFFKLLLRGGEKK